MFLAVNFRFFFKIRNVKARNVKDSGTVSYNSYYVSHISPNFRSFHDALWQWREVKAKAENVEKSKEFLVDDTAITSQFISRKLEQIEKIVRKGQVFGGDPNAARSKWLNAGRGTLSQKPPKNATKKQYDQMDQIDEDELYGSLQTIQAESRKKNFFEKFQ